RAFGTTPQAVARFALAFARGLAQAAVLACGKHFPGHGATVGDSHFVLPRVRRSRREFAAIDLLPFARAAAAGIPALMTAHVVVPALDGRRTSDSRGSSRRRRRRASPGRRPTRDTSRVGTGRESGTLGDPRAPHVAAKAGATDEYARPADASVAMPVQHADGWRRHRCG